MISLFKECRSWVMHAQKHVYITSGGAHTTGRTFLFLVNCISARAYRCSRTTHHKRLKFITVVGGPWQAVSMLKMFFKSRPPFRGSLCLLRIGRVLRAICLPTHTHACTRAHTHTYTPPGLHLNFKDSLHCHTQKQTSTFTKQNEKKPS